MPAEIKAPKVLYFMNIWLAQNLDVLRISFLFLKYFFGSLKVGNQIIS